MLKTDSIPAIGCARLAGVRERACSRLVRGTDSTLVTSKVREGSEENDGRRRTIMAWVSMVH